MDYTTLGRTELKVSVAGLGCGGFSRLGLNTGGTEASAVGIIHAALDHGVNLLDTAAPYDTEGVVGKAIKRVPRDQVVIATKASVFRGGERYASERVVASLDNSLRELGIDCIDVFQLHAVPPSGYDYVRDVIAPVLLKEKEKGKFKFLGITETSPNDLEHQMLLRAIPDGLWDVVMVAFHLMNQNTREAVFPATLQHRVGTLLMFAVRSIFARADRVASAMRELAAEGKVPQSLADNPDPLGFLIHPGGATSLTDAAYRYVRHEPGVDVVLFGTGDQAHLCSNIDSILRPPLPQADRDKLKQLFSHLRGVGLVLPPRAQGATKGATS
ncbi:MAG TPA: aldo/keto reductase [Acetobacteraceae bacterium]|nr:aldo/keto reductase [Acetobacteraceae bacterium]